MRSPWRNSGTFCKDCGKSISRQFQRCTWCMRKVRKWARETNPLPDELREDPQATREAEQELRPGNLEGSD